MHLASVEYDVNEVAKRLDAYPNLSSKPQHASTTLRCSQAKRFGTS